MHDQGAIDNHDGERLHDRLQRIVGDRTLRRVGEMTNTHPETVRRYLNGHAPSVDFVSRLAEALGLNVNWILTGRGPMRIAELKIAALRDANATDLLTHVALAIERLETKVERLDRYTHVLEIMIRQGGSPDDRPAADRSSASSIESKPSIDTASEQPAPANPAAATGPAPGADARLDGQAVQGPGDRARGIADAIPQRPRPDDR